MIYLFRYLLVVISFWVCEVILVLLFFCSLMNIQLLLCGKFGIGCLVCEIMLMIWCLNFLQVIGEKGNRVVMVLVVLGIDGYFSVIVILQVVLCISCMVVCVMMFNVVLVFVMKVGKLWLCFGNSYFMEYLEICWEKVVNLVWIVVRFVFVRFIRCWVNGIVKFL